MSTDATHPRDLIYLHLEAERLKQDAKWGEQNHPNGTGSASQQILALDARLACDRAAEEGTLTWAHILGEEVCEALAEDDPSRLRTELTQVAAVAISWIEAIERRA